MNAPLTAYLIVLALIVWFVVLTLKSARRHHTPTDVRVNFILGIIIGAFITGLPLLLWI